MAFIGPMIAQAGSFLGSIGGSASISNVVSLAGAGLSAVSQIQGAKHNQAMLEYNTAAARVEASAAEDKHRRDMKRRAGADRASIAKSGVTSAGSPLLVLAESAANAEMDALNIRIGAESTARVNQAKSRDIRRAGYIGAGTSLLSGYSKLRRV